VTHTGVGKRSVSLGVEEESDKTSKSALKLEFLSIEQVNSRILYQLTIYIISFLYAKHNMTKQTTSRRIYAYHSSNKERDTARSLHRIKRRLLRDLENEGGTPDNNWRKDESRSHKRNVSSSSYSNDRG
jgi:hypothetical protein